jgi:hypothetical protein
MRSISEAEWQHVFSIRCRAKRGSAISSRELAFCEKARDQDPDRYRAMEAAVFNATVPAGSTAKRES